MSDVVVVDSGADESAEEAVEEVGEAIADAVEDAQSTAVDLNHEGRLSALEVIVAGHGEAIGELQQAAIATADAVVATAEQVDTVADMAIDAQVTATEAVIEAETIAVEAEEDSEPEPVHDDAPTSKTHPWFKKRGGE